jgi:hypothetical protein
MRTHLAFAAALILGTSALTSLPAQANGRVQWSVAVGSPGYQSYPPPGVVVWPQSQYIYGAPPSAFAPPPPVVYVQPAPVIVYPPPVQYVDPYVGPRYPLREYREHRRHDRHDWDGRRGHWER